MLEVTAWNDVDEYRRRMTSTEPQPCLLLRKDLPIKGYMGLARQFKMMWLVHENEWRLGILFGVWELNVPLKSECVERMDTFQAGDEDVCIGDPELESGSGYLLSPSLSDAQLKHIRRVFETEMIEIDGAEREQIVFVWIDVTSELEDLEDG